MPQAAWASAKRITTVLFGGSPSAGSASKPATRSSAPYFCRNGLTPGRYSLRYRSTSSTCCIRTRYAAIRLLARSVGDHPHCSSSNRVTTPTTRALPLARSSQHAGVTHVGVTGPRAQAALRDRHLTKGAVRRVGAKDAPSATWEPPLLPLARSPPGSRRRRTRERFGDERGAPICR